MSVLTAIVLVTLLPLLPQDPPPRPAQTVDSILTRHLAFIGGQSALANAGDLALIGNVDSEMGPMRWRVLIRRTPFAWREEFTQGERQYACVSDGERAWVVTGSGTPQLLSTVEVVSILETSFFEGQRYLDPAFRRREMMVAGTWVLDAPETVPPAPGNGRAVDVIQMRSSAGTLWNCFFDAVDGRLHGMDDPVVESGRWRRYYGWKTWNGLTLPTSVMTGHHAAPNVMTKLRIDEVQTGLSHPAELFAGNPVPPLRGVVTAGELVTVRSHIPGSVRFLLPDVRVNARIQVMTLLDTGAGYPAVDTRLANALGLPVVGAGRTAANFGAVLSATLWLDAIDIGGHRLVQERVLSVLLPSIDEVPRHQAVGMLLGGQTLVDAAPVFDVEHGKLLFRGGPPEPLGAIGKAKDEPDATAEVLFVPLRYEEPGSSMLVVDVAIGERSIQVVLDTGMLPLLRLTPSGLRKLGLPDTRKAWDERGALPLRFGGAGGRSGVDLLVRVDAVQLGAIVYRRPWITLAGLVDADAEPLPWDGLLGAAALAPFARIGIDAAAGRLEFLPRAGVQRDATGVVVVPEPGEFLGLKLQAPEPGARAEPALLPRIIEVPPGSPAALAGILEGDHLLAIDGIPCAGQHPGALYEQLWPPAGRQIEVAVRKTDGRVLSLRLP